MNCLRKTWEFYQLNGLKNTILKILYFSTKKIHLQDVEKNKYLEVKNLLNALDISQKEYDDNRLLIEKFKNQKIDIKTINWFIPRFEHILYGGIFTIFRFAEYFAKKGIKNRVIIYDDPNIDSKKMNEQISSNFRNLAENYELLVYDGDLEKLPDCDISISTFWTSAFFNLRFNKCRRKYYFIQDYEPLFYAANTMYALTEMTYRFGFKGIVNTPGLAKYLKNRHETMDLESFIPSIDSSLYNISEDALKNKMSEDKIRIVTYGRPRHERNAFELTLEALKKVKMKYGQKVEIISVGDDWKEEKYGVKGIITNLGRLDSIKKVADLYRSAHIGLVFMFTPHPSYQPFEYMASGCCVVSNYNSANLWFLKDQENSVLTEPTPNMVFESISNLIENKEKMLRIANQGILTIKNNSWEEQCSKIYNYILA